MTPTIPTIMSHPRASLDNIADTLDARCDDRDLMDLAEMRELAWTIRLAMQAMPDEPPVSCHPAEVVTIQRRLTLLRGGLA